MSEVRTAIAGLGWWGRKMTDLIQSKGRGLKIIRAADPSAEARDFAAAKNVACPSVLRTSSPTRMSKR